MTHTLLTPPARAWLQPGMVISIPIFWFYRHKGIVSDQWHRGKPMVISNSDRSGGTCEESWDVFAQGEVVTVDGYPGGLPSYEVLNRARSFIGTRYDLFGWNCEHFVAYAHGLQKQSPQVVITMAIAALCVCVLAVAK